MHGEAILNHLPWICSNFTILLLIFPFFTGKYYRRIARAVDWCCPCFSRWAFISYGSQIASRFFMTSRDHSLLILTINHFFRLKYASVLSQKGYIYIYACMCFIPISWIVLYWSRVGKSTKLLNQMMAGGEDLSSTSVEGWNSKITLWHQIIVTWDYGSINWVVFKKKAGGGHEKGEVVVASKFLDIWYPLDAREALLAACFGTGSWFLKWIADQRKKKSLFAHLWIYGNIHL